MQCMMNCQPQNRKRRNKQLPVYHKESRYETSRASTFRWRLCSFHICGFAQEMASTSHFIWTASAPSSAMWSAPALSMACSGVRAPHRTCRPGIIRAVRAMTSCALVQWYFSQRSDQLSSSRMACARRAGWKQGFVFRVLPSG